MERKHFLTLGAGLTVGKLDGKITPLCFRDIYVLTADRLAQPMARKFNPSIARGTQPRRTRNRWTVLGLYPRFVSPQSQNYLPQQRYHGHHTPACVGSIE